MPGADAGPNLKIDRGAIQQAVDDDEGDAEYRTPEVKSGDTAGRAGGRVGNCKRGKMARHEGIKNWKEGANCPILEHFVRFVLPVAGHFLALNNIRARIDFPSSHKSSVNCCAFKNRPLRGRKLTPMAIVNRHIWPKKM